MKKKTITFLNWGYILFSSLQNSIWSTKLSLYHMLCLVVFAVGVPQHSSRTLISDQAFHSVQFTVIFLGGPIPEVNGCAKMAFSLHKSIIFSFLWILVCGNYRWFLNPSLPQAITWTMSKTGEFETLCTFVTAPIMFFFQGGLTKCACSFSYAVWFLIIQLHTHSGLKIFTGDLAYVHIVNKM